MKPNAIELSKPANYSQSVPNPFDSADIIEFPPSCGPQRIDIAPVWLGLALNCTATVYGCCVLLSEGEYFPWTISKESVPYGRSFLLLLHGRLLARKYTSLKYGQHTDRSSAGALSGAIQYEQPQP